jgi:hypothetical protein
MTKRLILAGWVLLTAVSGLSGCVVRERTVARPGGCPGGYWVEGHRSQRGRWHPGHYRCPGQVERIEID